MLESAENGWHVRYFPSPTQEFGGYNLFFKFSEGSVTVASEIESNPSTTETSLYSFGEDLGVTLNFDTKNSLINYFVHPKNPDNIGSTYKGMEGDYKFTVMETSAAMVVLRGIITGNYYILTPVSADTDWSEDLETYRNNAEDMSFNTYSFVVKDKTYSATLTNRRFAVKIDSETTVYAPFIYTKAGISFYMPVEIDGVTAQNFTFVDDYYFAEVNGADFKIMTPEPVRSDITFEVTAPDATKTYNSVTVNTVPSTDTEYYYMGLMLKSEFEAQREKKLLQSLVGTLNGNIGAGDDPEAIAASLLHKGADTYTLNYPSFYDEYVAVVFGCAVSNGFIVSTTPITSLPVSIDASLLPDNTDPLYKRWLGKWRVTSTTSQVNEAPVTFEVIVKPGTVNSSYMIRGWGITIYGNRYDLRAYYRASYNGASTPAIPIPKSTGFSTRNRQCDLRLRRSLPDPDSLLPYNPLDRSLLVIYDDPDLAQTRRHLRRGAGRPGNDVRFRLQYRHRLRRHRVLQMDGKPGILLHLAGCPSGLYGKDSGGSLHGVQLMDADGNDLASDTPGRISETGSILK